MDALVASAEADRVGTTGQEAGGRGRQATLFTVGLTDHGQQPFGAAYAAVEGVPFIDVIYGSQEVLPVRQIASTCGPAHPTPFAASELRPVSFSPNWY